MQDKLGLEIRLGLGLTLSSNLRVEAFTRCGAKAEEPVSTSFASMYFLSDNTVFLHLTLHAGDGMASADPLQVQQLTAIAQPLPLTRNP